MTALPAPLPQSFRFPGVLNSQEMLVAEALQHRAWGLLERRVGFGSGEEDQARACLARIVVRLMAAGDRSMSELTSRAVDEFLDEWVPGRGR